MGDSGHGSPYDTRAVLLSKRALNCDDDQAGVWVIAFGTWLDENREKKRTTFRTTQGNVMGNEYVAWVQNAVCETNSHMHWQLLARGVQRFEQRRHAATVKFT